MPASRASPSACTSAWPPGRPGAGSPSAGGFPAALPAPWRGLALVQAALLLAMAGAVLDRAGAIGPGLPGWAFPASGAMTALSLLANAASPSRPERLLWTPVLLAMLTATLAVALA